MILAALCLVWAISFADAVFGLPDPPAQDLTSLSIEELMNIEIEVTSAARTAQKLSETAAAVYVVTQEDIRRTGAENIPEALRMVPGLDVAHIDANRWAVSSRGFNDLFANKMLVLMDGRSVYTPVFSGVWWDSQDTLMSDIERIEVVRGPGATMWGANAVNGVINIITKNTRATQGGFAAIEAGGAEYRNLNEFRYGGMLGSQGHYRIYAKQFTHNAFEQLANDMPEVETWDQSRGGFRVDWTLPGNSTLTLQGDSYSGNESNSITVNRSIPVLHWHVAETADISGGNLVGRWNKTISSTSDMALQFYYDRTHRDDDLLYSETSNTYDLDFQHHFKPGSRHDLIWGFGYRYIDDQTRNGRYIFFDPHNRIDRLYSAFIQDDVTLVPGRTRLTVGSKFEHNDYTGFEIQPNVRLLWTPGNKQTVWAAVSRAVRTPARVETDGGLIIVEYTDAGGITNRVSLNGSRNYESEKLTAYEIGYRLQPRDRFSIDIATFCNVYDDLRAMQQLLPAMENGEINIPLLVNNKMSAKTYGAEFSSEFGISDRWRMAAGYTIFRNEMEIDPTLGDIFSKPLVDGSTPRNQFHIRSYYDLPSGMEFDVALYRVGNLPSKAVPGYTRLDVRLGWQTRQDMEVSLGFKNLLSGNHREFGSSYGEDVAEVNPSAYGRVTWHF